MRAIFLIAAVLASSQAFPAPTPNLVHHGNQERGAMEPSFQKGIPYSFVYGGHLSSLLLPSWQERTESQRLDSRRVQTTVWRTDPKSGLEVKCVSVSYSDFPATEWTVYLKNRGRQDTPIIENLLAVDEDFSHDGRSEFVLHHNVGSPANRSDYQPLETLLGRNSSKRISAAGGRATNSDMSYFNLSSGNRGTIIVVGWPGQWFAEFSRGDNSEVHVKAGQEQVHLKLHPGEEIRTPLTVLLNWSGDWINGQNQWRRWMMAHGMPKPGGHLPTPMTLGTSGRAYGEMIGANEANQKMHIDRYVEEKLGISFWWMDAGWYVQQQGWPQVGTWEVDKVRFPNGFRPISDYAHARGLKTMVWFEPERVAPGTWLADNHPEWLLNPLSALETNQSKKINRGEPCVSFNTSYQPLKWNGIEWLGRSVSLHPGPNGEYSVVRWTAPATSDYRFSGNFAGIDGQTTTDVHVMSGSKSLFDGQINLGGHGKRAPFEGAVRLRKGEFLDFIVGYGNGTYVFDSTGLDALIVGADRKLHSADAEYGTGAWKYGYLTPSPTPHPETFVGYDLRTHGGSSGNQLLDLGNPKAWQWLVNHVDKILVDGRIDLYRQDFNIDPLSFWVGNDPPDRLGITENKHIVGYLAYWDELRRRHPNMLIDSCASGGRRNDLETMRRSVPLWRSDYAFEPIGHQGMTYGISMWLPYHGTGTVATSNAPYYGGGLTPVEPYAFWSNAAPSLVSGIDVREKGIDYDALRKLYKGLKELEKYYYGDYYPLTPYTQDEGKWIAWQFNLPEKNEGVIQAFRRGKAPSQHVVQLRGLDEKAIYTVDIIDAPGSERLSSQSWSGRELMTVGLPITLTSQPSAAVIRFHKRKR